MRSKICFLSTVNPSDQRSWSGITFHLFRILSEDHDVYWPGPIKFPLWASYIYAAWNKVNRFLGRRFTSHNHLYSIFSGMTIRKMTRGQNYDYIVVGAGEPELVAFFRTTIPIFYVADTTFERMVDFYPWHTGLCNAAIRQGNNIEKRAIGRSFHLFYSSEWAAESAMKKYGADSSKISIAPFGPALIQIPDRKLVLERVRKSTLSLLFIGSDWDRKGGPIAFDTFKLLRNSGLDCSLTIVGCVPTIVHDQDCKIVPYLDKNDPVQMQLLYNIFISSEILISPSRADCTPVAFSEAAVFGIPVITSDTGGVSAIVKNGKNGYCLPYDAAPEEFSESIKEIWQSPVAFDLLRISSRGEYENRLNWEHWKVLFNKAVNPLSKNEKTNPDHYVRASKPG